MPRIPGYRADQQRELRGPYNVAEADPMAGQVAGAWGKAMDGVMEYAKKEKRYEAAKKEEQENIELNSLKQELKAESDTTADNSFKTANLNGDGLVEKYDEDMDKSATNRIKKIKDPITQQKAYAAYLDIKNDKRNQLMGERRKMFTNYANEATESIKNTHVANTMSNPNDYDKNYAAYQDQIMKSQYTPDVKLKALKSGREEMANSALKGLVNAGEYDEAKSRLVNKFGKDGIYDEEKLSKWSDKIDQEKVKALNLSVKEDSREEALYKESLEKRKDKNFLGMYEKVTKLNEVDLANPGKGKSLESTNKEIDELVVSNELRFAEAQHLKRFLNKEQSEDQAHVTLDLYSKLSKGGNLKNLKEEVLKASTSRSISPQTAQSLLGKIDSEGDKRAKRLAKGSGNAKAPMVGEAESLIDDHFKYSEYSAPYGSKRVEKAEMEVETKKKFYELMASPKYKKDPLSAARKALDQTVPTYNYPKSLPIKEKEVMDSPEAAGAKLKSKLIKGEIDRKSYINGLLAIKNVKLKMQRGEK